MPKVFDLARNLLCACTPGRARGWQGKYWTLFAFGGTEVEFGSLRSRDQAGIRVNNVQYLLSVEPRSKVVDVGETEEKKNPAEQRRGKRQTNRQTDLHRKSGGGEQHFVGFVGAELLDEDRCATRAIGRAFGSGGVDVAEDFDMGLAFRKGIREVAERVLAVLATGDVEHFGDGAKLFTGHGGEHGRGEGG